MASSSAYTLFLLLRRCPEVATLSRPAAALTAGALTMGCQTGNRLFHLHSQAEVGAGIAVRVLLCTSISGVYGFGLTCRDGCTSLYSAGHMQRAAAPHGRHHHCRHVPGGVYKTLDRIQRWTSLSSLSPPSSLSPIQKLQQVPRTRLTGNVTATSCTVTRHRTSAAGRARHVESDPKNLWSGGGCGKAMGQPFFCCHLGVCKKSEMGY